MNRAVKPRPKPATSRPRNKPMPAVESRWTAEHSQHFSYDEEKVRGYIRYEVSRQNLSDTLSEFLSSPKRIIDIGGGAGGDAAWLSNLSPAHEVTLIDPNSKSIGRAVARRSRIRTFSIGDSRRALEINGAESFDLALSHGVLQYLDDPRAELDNIARLLRPKGYISLMTAGKFGKLRRYSGNEAAVNRLLLDGCFTNNLGAKATAYLPNEIESMLSRAGFETIEWFGTKVVSDDDHRRVDEVSGFELNSLFSTELELSRDPTRRVDGQMLHFIARKNTQVGQAYPPPNPEAK